jgi:hypothetical protein
MPYQEAFKMTNARPVFVGFPSTLEKQKPTVRHSISLSDGRFGVKRCGASQARRRSLSAVDPIATTLLQRRE